MHEEGFEPSPSYEESVLSGSPYCVLLTIERLISSLSLLG